jgi:hypothetical protein
MMYHACAARCAASIAGAASAQAAAGQMVHAPRSWPWGSMVVCAAWPHPECSMMHGTAAQIFMRCVHAMRQRFVSLVGGHAPGPWSPQEHLTPQSSTPQTHDPGAQGRSHDAAPFPGAALLKRVPGLHGAFPSLVCECCRREGMKRDVGNR